MALDLSYGHSPFPFSDRPALPHIDAFQDNEKLRVTTRNGIPLSPVSKFHQDIPRSDDDMFGHFSFGDIKLVHRFIKSCGNDDGYGITLDDLESAVRRVKRAHKNKDEESYARRLMNTFEFLLKIKSLSPKLWFKEVDTSQANKGDGKLTWLEFESGMNKLCDDLGASQFSKHDLTVILKYMDPNGDGDLSYHEVQKGFKRIHQPADCLTILETSGPIVPYLQEFMRDRQIRVRDLFNFFDIKNKKVITLESFCDGMERVSIFMVPPASPRPQQQSRAPAPKSADAAAKRNKFGDVEITYDNYRNLPPLKKKSSSTSRKKQGMSSSTLLLSPVASPTRHEGDYKKKVGKHFRVYDDWLKQFDRKLQNGLVLMTKM
jgi:hypothetical protein